MEGETKDGAEMQAECIVRAIDMYLSAMPWPSPNVEGRSPTAHADIAEARKLLVNTFAATIRMSEPRRSALQRYIGL